ncbi:bacteriocin [Kordia sp. YSTF-M3]|uniref:Bacteriocin n=1 Tax=Kordia aestuariivivens TaxID=2759037 RepID=A0ABR7Q3D0_9FLAO|nr:bacteriocin [Kordia aestuariivivens]MBC8753047.1 bacteriocin [Kordia aestuariivivens]
MLEKFQQLTKEQMNAVYGGAQDVADIDRTQPN